MTPLHQALTRSLGKGSVFTDELTLMATSADAGCYRKVPKIVLKPQDEKQVVDALKILYAQKTPLTFRAAGTSLSGQAISDSVLLQARGDRWSSYEILDEGRSIKAQPGITGTRLNQLLAHTGMKFGPAPGTCPRPTPGSPSPSTFVPHPTDSPCARAPPSKTPWRP